MTAFGGLQQQLAELKPVKGIAPVDILSLPDSVSVVVRKMMRGGMTLTVLADELGLPLDQARKAGDMLVEKGYLISEAAEKDGVKYKVYLARMRSHNIALDL